MDDSAAGLEGPAALMGLLRCPRCSAELAVGRTEAACAARTHRFPVVENIPIFLDEDALAANPQYSSQRRYFGKQFAAYDAYTLEHWRLSYIQRLRAAGVLGDGSVPLLDVGVGGSGYTVIEAARSRQSAVGCDLTLEAVLSARRFAEGERVGERAFWVCSSAERLPFASDSFASVLAIAVLEHVPDDRAALREAARVVQPRGSVWVTVPHALRYVPRPFRIPNRLHDRRLGHLRRYEAEGLIQLGRSVGLDAVDLQLTGHPVKVLQLAASGLFHGSVGERLWWWCEARDLRDSDRRRGSMQLSVLFRRPR